VAPLMTMPLTLVTLRISIFLVMVMVVLSTKFSMNTLLQPMNWRLSAAALFIAHFQKSEDTDGVHGEW